MAEDGFEMNSSEAMRGMEAQMHDFSYREGTLAHLRDVQEEQRRKGEPLRRIQRVDNVLSYLRAARDDAPPDDRSNFTERLNAAAALTDYHHDGATDPNLDNTKEYFIKERSHWEEEMMHATGDERAVAERNLELFDSFLETLNLPQQEEETLAQDHALGDVEPSPQVEIATDEEIAALNRDISEIEEVPADIYEPKEAAHLIDRLKKNSEVTLDDVEEFIEAYRIDVPDERLITAVQKASEFYEKNGNNGKSRRSITVTIGADGTAEAGWQPRLFRKRRQEGKLYIFNPNASIKDPHSLGRNDLEAGKIKNALKDVENAKMAIQKIKEHQQDTIAPTERWGLERIVDRFGRMQEGKPDKKIDEKAIAYMKNMSDFIQSQLEPQAAPVAA